jgi:uncharacterized protein (DUF2225 family)
MFLYVLNLILKNFFYDFYFQVAVDEKFSEPLALIDLFGFKGEKTSSSSTYMGNLKKKIFE